MKAIEIRVAANGFMAGPGRDPINGPCEYFEPPFVFETFEDLSAWLRINLDVPEHRKPECAPIDEVIKSYINPSHDFH